MAGAAPGPAIQLNRYWLGLRGFICVVSWFLSPMFQFVIALAQKVETA
jgi:hypothetical protein